MYTETFRNTFVLDVLEYLNIVRIPQEPTASNISEDSQRTLHEAPYSDLEAHGSNDFGNHNGMEKGENDGANELEEVSQGKDPFLVEYNGPDDPERPVNWPLRKKAMVAFQVQLLTCVTYLGTAIYTPGQEEIQKAFGVGHVVATLNLSMYILGFGLGPMVFSPLSEFAIFGRQQLYIFTLFLFAMLQIGCALVDNIAGLVILRFITGILCSPSLSTGAATISEIVTPPMVPVMIGMWSIGAVAAPAIGPVLGAAMLVAKNWRFMFWLLMWLSSATLIILALFFPETYEENVLYRRCKRIQKTTGDKRYFTTKSREESKLAIKDIAINALWRPIEIIVKEPIVLALDSYLALAYGTFYLFFEAFPIVFLRIHHFTTVELGLSYLGFVASSFVAYAVSLSFFRLFLPPIVKRGAFTPEKLLILAMWVCWCGPAALFMFGWTASVHWILPIISELFWVLFLFNLFQAIFSYLAMSYPKYVASVFAGNGLFRSGFACGFPLFGQAMYDNLAIKGYPVAWGSSLLGFITIGLGILPFVLYRTGPYLRSKSSFTG
ncbi:hypothetical protein ZYGR_0AS01990 [Zygosaccharomyces rouxii]|uniref:Major facilitator superfamily (MFS) profile domain-containing protein n=1 Tax=Zygosaccharomyces rouxii TaxID=4956 RepID=A0A1Q3AGH0_ZYGRO|nr:hypothetical protein ZYGR_0AS01990 [Zygosaccharomyces rouxii]